MSKQSHAVSFPRDLKGEGKSISLYKSRSQSKVLLLETTSKKKRLVFQLLLYSKKVKVIDL